MQVYGVTDPTNGLDDTTTGGRTLVRVVIFVPCRVWARTRSPSPFVTDDYYPRSTLCGTVSADMAGNVAVSPAKQKAQMRSFRGLGRVGMTIGPATLGAYSHPPPLRNSIC